MLNQMQKAIIFKDIKEITSNKQVLLPMILVPALLMIVIPSVFFIIISNIPANELNMNEFMDKISFLSEYTDKKQMIIDLVINNFLPAFFLLIPVMSSSTIGAGCFVIEKERKTLESLFYTPITIKQIFWSKILATFIPSIIVSLITFVLFGIVVNIGAYSLFDKLIFPSLKWILVALLLTPAISLLSLAFIIRVSAKVTNFQESQQLVGLIILPIILSIVGQASGFIIINNWFVVLSAIIIYILTFVLINIFSKNFTYEKLLG